MFLKSKIFFIVSLSILTACNLDDDNDPELIIDPVEEIVIPEDIADYYAEVDFNLTEEELKEELAVLTIAKHTTFLEYYERHDYLYTASEDPGNPDNVVLIYNSESRNKQEYLSGSNTYSPQTFNTEHVYPQSYLDNNAQADLHNLQPADVAINSKRGNYPFIEGEGTYSLINNNSWYPGDEWIGDVARMLMYMNLRYNEGFNDVGSLELFLKWNAEDPVSVLEVQRNNAIEEAQGNRNPFIDNPVLATAIWGGDDMAENRWNENYQGPTVIDYEEIESDNEDEDEGDNGDDDGETDGGNNTGILLFSEYIEGSGNNKALEIVNLTEEAVNLEAAGYSIQKQVNGNGEWSNSHSLTGTLPAGEVLVIINSNSDLEELLAEADIKLGGAPIDFNGNDPVGLFKDGVLIDMIGVEGDEDFGPNVTLRRKAAVTTPNTTYDPEEWEVLEQNDVSGIGSYN